MKPFKRKTIIMRTDGDKRKALTILEGLPLKPKYEIEFRLYKLQRSVLQNKLYWKWITIIGNELGYTKEEMHELYKERLLIPIFIRDNEGFAEMVGAVKAVRGRKMKEQADILKREIIRLTSTTDCTTAQFAEYLTDIERDAANLSIILPHPDDLYWESLGIKRKVKK